MWHFPSSNARAMILWTNNNRMNNHNKCGVYSEVKKVKEKGREKSAQPMNRTTKRTSKIHHMQAIRIDGPAHPKQTHTCIKCNFLFPNAANKFDCVTQFSAARPDWIAQVASTAHFYLHFKYSLAPKNAVTMFSIIRVCKWNGGMEGGRSCVCCSM